MKKTMIACLMMIVVCSCSTDDGNSIIEQQVPVGTPSALLMGKWVLTGAVHEMGGNLVIEGCLSEELDFKTDRDFYRKLTITAADTDPPECNDIEVEGTFFVNPEKTTLTTVINVSKSVQEIVKLTEQELHLKITSDISPIGFKDFTFFYTKVN